MRNRWALYFSLALTVAAVLIPVYFRFYPLNMPSFDQQARLEVLEEERAAVEKGVEKQFSDASPNLKAKMSRELFKDVRRTERDRINEKTAARGLTLKERFRDERGQAYLGGIDSYYWYRLLTNLLAKGHIGDRRVQGVEYDDLIGVPIDPATTKNVHIWLGWIFFRVASAFAPGVPLSQVLFFVPVFLVALVAAMGFRTARSLGADDIGAFFASLTVSLSPIFIGRSISEWFDTDIYNVLFPLLIFGTAMSLMAAAEPRRRLGLAALSGLFCALYASTWKGWWFIFDILVLSGGFFILNEKLSEEPGEVSGRSLRQKTYSLLAFVVSAGFFVILFNGIAVWSDVVMEPLRLFKVMKVTQESVWPNVYLTVAELGRLTSPEIVSLLGGYFIFFSSLIGLMYIFLVERGLRDERTGFGLLSLVLWVLLTYYSAFEAMRFVLLLLVPVGLAFGLMVSKLRGVIGRWGAGSLPPAAVEAGRLAVTAVLSVALFFGISRTHRLVVGSSTPMMDDRWYRVLTKIERETPADSVINSWWDFGHWFKAVSQRRVLFDGMTQNTPPAYWIARILLAQDEKEAIGILRMINASGNKAAELLEKGRGWPAGRAVETVREACGMDRDAARSYLQEAVKDPADVEQLMSYLFPADPPPVYFIASYDMIPKVTAISYVGNWDFDKVDAWLKHKKMNTAEMGTYLKRTYGMTTEQVRNRLIEMEFLDDREAKEWFSKQSFFYSGLEDGVSDGSLLFFDNGLVVDLGQEPRARLMSLFKTLRGKPKSLFYAEEGVLKKKAFDGETLDLSALVFKKNDAYKDVLLDDDLGQSLLVRLCYLNGEGLKHFKLWYKEEDEKGNDGIYVYEVLWPPQK